MEGLRADELNTLRYQSKYNKCMQLPDPSVPFPIKKLTEQKIP
jgi:hypothetical protein